MRSKLFYACLMVLALAQPAVAQAMTAIDIGVFPPNTTNPALTPPIAQPVRYPFSTLACNQVKVAETLPIVNPEEWRIDDPALPTRDCVVTIDTQFRALPVGTNLRASWRPVVASGPLAWTPVTTAFEVTAPQTHPCDGTPPVSGTVVAGTRTLSWCWNGLDANGTATTITTWTATVDGTRIVLTNVIVGATANAQGKRLYSASLSLTAGVRQVRVAGTNATGEAPFSAIFTVTVQVPPAVPSVSEIRSIQ